MPWAPADEPSLALAILKSKLAEEGVVCEVRHLQLDLLRFIDPLWYEPLADCFAINEFLFGGDLERRPTTAAQRRDLQRLLDERHPLDLAVVKRALGHDRVGERLVRLRDETIPKFLDHCVGQLQDHPATLIGFTCLFEQTFPSLALARRLSEACPEKMIAFGGYALQQPVAGELMRCFPFVDAVALGDGEERIAPLARASLDPRLLADIPELIYRDSDRKIVENPPARVPGDLNQSPDPDFSGWMDDLARLPADVREGVADDVLVAETSRGCWWGEVSHCVFCGIDDNTMRYRYKAPERALAMIRSVVGGHPGKAIRFSDYILPRSYYRTVLPALAADGGKARLHWEIKSNIHAEDADIMRAAGVVSVQPGIESLSSSVLKKMSKGVSAAQNILTLRLLAERRIGISYNLLWGLPTDEADEYLEQLRTVPMLYHLPPPGSCMPIVTVRYAPIQQDPARFAIRNPLRADRRYHLILSAEACAEREIDWSSLCYVFQRPYELDPEIHPLYRALSRQAEHWQELHRKRRPELSFRYTDQGVDYFDSRFAADGVTLSFSAAHARLQQALERRIVTEPELERLAGAELDSWRRARDELAEARLILSEGGRIVGLATAAVPAEANASEASKGVR